MPPPVTDIVLRCWDVTPLSRPSMAEIAIILSKHCERTSSKNRKKESRECLGGRINRRSPDSQSNVRVSLHEIILIRTFRDHKLKEEEDLEKLLPWMLPELRENL